MAKVSIKGSKTTNQDYLDTIEFLQQEYADKHKVREFWQDSY